VRIFDTDICIEILRGNQQLIDHRRHTFDEDVVTTWITAAELYFGAENSAKPRENSVLVAEFLETLDVLFLSETAVHHFGRVKAQLQREGRGLADFDLLIAAIALAHDAVLVTGNERHFGRIPGLKMENWRTL
jgi:tRNA(fMet)-specific endonuclease VapC